eukprot:jgi/Ulvmu1/3197/UM015_0238.1
MQLHDNDSRGICTMAALGGNILITADSHGIMHTMILHSTYSVSSSCALPAQHTSTYTLESGLFEMSDAVLASRVGSPMACGEVLPLHEVLEVMRRKQFERKRGKWKDSISSAIQSYAKRLAQLKRRNDAVSDGSERLSPGDLVITDQLAFNLRSAGIKCVADLKTALMFATGTQKIKANKILEHTRHTMEAQEEAISSIPVHQPVTSAESRIDKKGPSNCATLLYSMAMPTRNAQQKDILNQHTFLRGVEQFEWSKRPLQHHGIFAAVERACVSHAADAATTVDDQNSVPAAINVSTVRQADSQHLAHTRVYNGKCHLLYAPFQLHLHRRKIAQLQLLVLEELAARSSFNYKFRILKESKGKTLEKIEEQLARISSIQVELGFAHVSADLVPAPEEDEARLIQVEAHELKALEWLPSAERKRREDAAMRKVQQQAAANGNKFQAIALDQMMNGSPEKRKQHQVEQLQQREPWMDIPVKAMSQAQREALKKYERQVQEAEENLRNTHRILEGECKASEEEIAVAVDTFNLHVEALQHERLWYDVQLVISQELRLSIVSTLLEAFKAAKSKALEGVKVNIRKKRLTRLRSINEGLMRRVAGYHTHYLELAHKCKLVDGCFTKAFQGLGAQAAVDLYRNVENCPTYIRYGVKHGSGVVPEPNDLLEGSYPPQRSKVNKDRLGAGKADSSGEFAGKCSWRPAGCPPVVPSWNDGPALSPEHRPEAIPESDWAQIMHYRDCRLGLLEKLAQAWGDGAACVSVMDAYAAEHMCLTNKVQEAHQQLEQVHINIQYNTIDVPIVFAGRGGQIEVTEGQLLPDMQNAVLVKRDIIQALNHAVQEQAAKVLELLEDCSQLRSNKAAIAWESSLSDLAAEHKSEHVKELQLFHVTRGVQALLDCNRSAASKNASEGKILDRLRDLSQRVQANQIKERSLKFIALTDAVAMRLEMNEELCQATTEAFLIVKRNDHIKHLDERNASDRAARTETRFKRMAIQNKLRALALTQTKERVVLLAEKETLIERNFPSFRRYT